MVVDYEAAWAELTQRLADSDRPQHGTQFLLAEMQRIAANCRVSESGLPRALRLYGVEVALGRVRADIRDVGPSPDDVSPEGDAAEMEPRRAHRTTIDPGGHDGITAASAREGAPAPV